MTDEQLMTLLLYGGIAVIGLGLALAVVMLVVVLVRRSRTAREPRRAAPEVQLPATSPFAAYQVPARETSDSSSLSSAFVAGPRQSAPTVPTASGPGGSSSGGWPPPPPPPPGTGAPAAVPAPAVPPGAVPPAAAVPQWRDIVESAPDAEPFQYTTGSFAVPPSAPLANPWAGTGPQSAPPVAPTAPAAPVVPVAPIAAAAPAVPVAPVAPVAPTPAAPPVASVEDVAPPTPVVPATPPTPAAAPAPAVLPSPPEPAQVADAAPADEDEDEATVLIAGREAGPAPWLLILDSGDRIGITGDAVVLGRRPAAVEHGVPGVAVPDPTKTLSKVHARLDLVDGQWTVTDLGSTNGTSVIESGGRERVLPRGGAEVVRGRFLLGEVGLVLVQNPEAKR